MAVHAAGVASCLDGRCQHPARTSKVTKHDRHSHGGTEAGAVSALVVVWVYLDLRGSKVLIGRAVLL